SAQNELLWGASLNGAYALGPGISLEGQVAYTQADYGMLTGGGVSVPGRRQRQPGPLDRVRPRHGNQLLGERISSAIGEGRRDALPPGGQDRARRNIGGRLNRPCRRPWGLLNPCPPSCGAGRSSVR